MNIKTFTSLLIGCALALAGAAMAQKPEEEATPKEKAATEKTHVTPPKSGANAAKPEATAAKERGATHERATSKALKTEATPKSATSTATETNVSGEPGASATPGAKQGAERRKGTRGTNAKASPSATVATKASPSATAAAAATASATPVTAATASAAPTVAGAGQTNARANAAGAAKKPDPQQVQQIKQQHTNFRAQPKPQQVPAVTFNQSYRIEGSDRWQGRQYEAFRSYHPERHDQGWYRSHYPRVELIGGGYYYWNNGYWYPAWGYSPSAEYYAYDGPIYVGQRAQPPDQVIADVQAVLQQMGYYKGDVDGLLGPLTRQALTAYQADQGLTTTAAIDEPTLDSLGMG
jgi:Putative peptidoglycan binding domain